MIVTIIKWGFAALVTYWLVGSDNMRELKDSFIYGTRNLSKDAVKNTSSLFKWIGDMNPISLIVKWFISEFISKKSESK